jgi:UDP-N-acetylglucosamine 2-epimerase (non-hydrolysing)
VGRKKLNNYKTKKVLFIFGTRPETIKLAPVIREFSEAEHYRVEVCVTGQHKELLKEVLDFFEIGPDYSLGVMVENQSLFYLTSTILSKLEEVLETSKPDWIFVQGDTTTTFVASLAAFYKKIKIAHIEAGLRSLKKYSPFPEEINRILVSHLADIHFAPTEKAKEGLLREGIEDAKIFVVGNPVVDALLWGLKKVKNLQKEAFGKSFDNIDFSKRILLITGHRRESFGKPFENICLAIKEIARLYADVEIVYPVHLNPNVRKPVFKILGEEKRVHLLKPLSYPAFIWLMDKSYVILTDSGGIQEEAPSLGKPTLVMRDVTERTEGIESNHTKLVGTNKERIITELTNILEAEDIDSRKTNSNPYGDGQAAKRIIKIIQSGYRKNETKGNIEKTTERQNSGV